MFVEAFEAILGDFCSPDAIREMEAGLGFHGLFGALADAGFLELLGADAAAGGANASWREFHDILVLLGRHALPLPLASTLAARAVAAEGQALPCGLLSFAPTLLRSTAGELVATHVPGAGAASHVIGMHERGAVVLPVASARLTPSGIHASLTATLVWGGQDVPATPLPLRIDAAQFAGLGAAMHAAMIAGAAQRAFELTLLHAGTRQQFGRPIGQFQAVQQQLSVMAGQLAAAGMAAQAAFASAGVFPNVAACAAAKARASEAAQAVASIAHAVHGAIGVTREYELQLYTRRLHEWRLAFGSEARWHRALGQLVADHDSIGIADFSRHIFEGSIP